MGIAKTEVSLEKWQQSLHGLDATTFPERQGALLRQCAQPNPQEEKWHLTIRTQEQTVDLVIYKDVYDSAAICREAFGSKPDEQYYYYKFYQKQQEKQKILLIRSDLQGKYGEVCNIYKTALLSGTQIKEQLCKPDEQYYYYKFYQKQQEKQKILLIRSDLQGKYGEVCNIYKTALLSGTQIKEQLCLPLLEALQIDTVFLNDEAKREGSLLLRLLLPVVTPAGTTWYSKHKFAPLTCSHLKFPGDDAQAMQDAKIYFSAVEHVRDTLLTTMEDKELISKLCATYLQTCRRVTVADLGAAIFNRVSQKDKKRDKRDTSQRDLHDFYKCFLAPRTLKANSTPAARIYNLALSTIFRHYVWARHYKEPEKDMSYPEFKKIAHKPFAKALGDIDIPPNIHWDAVAKILMKNRSKTTFV